MLRLNRGLPLKSNRADREQNILDAVSLPVNRLAFNRILSPGWQSDEGDVAPASAQKSYVLAALTGLIFFRARKFFPDQTVTFIRVLVTTVGSNFLQDRVLDCPREPQTSSCCKKLGRATRRLSWSCTIDTGTRFSVSPIGSSVQLKLRRTSRTTAF